MNIYFAGAIKGNSQGTHLYPIIIEELKKHGKVLTEIFQRLHQTPNQKQYTWDKEIFNQDITLLNQSNILVAEITWPSHGCGREICYAQYVLKIPVICLYLEWTNISSMLKWNDYLQLYSYTEENLLDTIQNKLINQDNILYYKVNDKWNF